MSLPQNDDWLTEDIGLYGQTRSEWHTETQDDKTPDEPYHFMKWYDPSGIILLMVVVLYRQPHPSVSCRYWVGICGHQGERFILSHHVVSAS